MGTSSSKQIEVEFRSRFDKNVYDRVEKFLCEKAIDLGEDNKDVFFYIFPDKTLKVVSEESKRTAKIALKLNKLGNGSDFEEIEIPFNATYFSKMCRVFENTSKSEIQHSYQKRHNYQYKDVEISLKFSEDWGYHLEIEQVIDDIKNKQSAEKNIKSVADELNITLMSDQEISDFCKTIDKSENVFYTSLATLAEQKNLPEHQIMDPETVGWIESNTPGFLEVGSMRPSKKIVDGVLRFTPRKQWFFLPAEVGGIHGIRHVSRVLIHALVLSIDDKYSDFAITLPIAAALHDIARFNDQGDLGHGRRAAAWLRNNQKTVETQFGLTLSDSEIEEIYWAIFFHETPLEEILQDENYLKHQTIIDLLKLADALDRYRLPKLKWWINPEFLNIKPTIEHLKFAYELCVMSEKKAVVDNMADMSVLGALKNLIEDE